jgi:hypothetical protein
MKRNIFNVKGHWMNPAMPRRKSATSNGTTVSPVGEGFARNYLAYLLARVFSLFPTSIRKRWSA